jgi:farnesyl-diphosphate farnesyltransferase
MANLADEMLTRVLRDVSRSFYLTLRALPAAVRRQIGLAYLLARTTDTIADTEIVTVDHRLRALSQLRDRILGLSCDELDFGELARQQGSSAERVLLVECEKSLALLEDLETADRERVRAVLATIVSGQELDLRRFAGASRDNVKALNSSRDLEDYAYRVAGCVGEFWTRMCRVHLFARDSLDDAALLTQGVRFGQGLQLVNILRDLPVDLRQGRCYLPAEELAACGLAPADLLDPAVELKMRPLYDAWLAKAEQHLQAGWLYTNSLPRRCCRVRLACAWPLLIGRETLALLRAGKVLDPLQRLKVSRAQVRGIIWRSIVFYPWPSAWRSLYPPGHTSHSQ